jgi:hypothetical protein
MPAQEEEEQTNELGAMSTEASRNPFSILAGKAKQRVKEKKERQRSQRDWLSTGEEERRDF